MKTFAGPDPVGPELAPIEAIHRHGDGVVTFHRKNAEGEFQNLFGIRSEHLGGMFPEFREQLERDSFFSLNAFWHWERGAHYIAAVQARKPERLRYLCSCFCDLDCYNLGLTFGQVLGAVADLEEEGLVPPASMIVSSGRGMWLLWLLHDAKDPSIPPRAWPEKQALYFELQRAIGKRFGTLGVDAAARDPLRLARVPGSVHTLSRLRVKYRIQYDEHGRGFTYTIEDMAKYFGVEAPKLQPVRQAMAEVEKPKNQRRRGWDALNRRRLAEFEVLRSIRGGFGKGCRNRAAMIYAWLLRCNGVSRDDAAVSVNLFGAKCKPSLTPAQCRDAVRTGYGKTMRRMQDQTISDWLSITPGEAEMLTKLPPATQYGGAVRMAEEKPAAVNTKAIRQHVIQQIVLELKRVPTCREMADMLKTRGHSVSHVIVFRDYKELALQWDRTRDAAAARKLKQTQMFATSQGSC